MKYLFTLLTVLVTVIHSKATDSSSNTPESVPFLEQGKTWWYEVTDEYPDKEANRLVDRHTVFGIRLEDTTEYEGEKWMECYFVTPSGERITTSPVALLREKDRKVYVTATHLDLGLNEWTKKDGKPIAVKPYLDIIVQCANFTHAQEDWLGRYVSDPQTSFPAILYDFSWIEGDTFVWPWYGSRVDFMWDENDETIENPVPVELQVSKAGTLTDSGYTLGYLEFARSKELKQNRDGVDLEPMYKGRIIEGVGLLGMKLLRKSPAEYYPAYDLGGFFFTPGQFFGPLSEIPSIPKAGFDPPVLLGVERPDGTLLYGDESRPWSGVRSVQADLRLADDTLYDLTGRRVERPVKGSVYVRQGKKVVF